MEKQNRIRVKVLAWLQEDSRIFVVRMHDSEKGDDYYRPIGGSVEFGESTREALLREVKEELNTQIHITGEPIILENIFTCDGEQGHEIDYVYPSRFADPSFTRHKSYVLTEADGNIYEAGWIDLSRFVNDELRLVPEQLLEWCQAGN